MRVPRSIVLLPPILGVFYYGWTRRHEFVHEGAEQRRQQTNAQNEAFRQAQAKKLNVEPKSPQ
eukprot:m.45629 g.45629  ORF g.45629 m.45629 type:complete len:63 (-) comp20014_c0_seq2:169-357(-)